MVKCRDCRFKDDNYITGIHGQGLYKFAYCQRLIHDCKVIDPDVERECEDFREKINENLPGEVTKSDTKAAEGDT